MTLKRRWGYSWLYTFPHDSSRILSCWGVFTPFGLAVSDGIPDAMRLDEGTVLLGYFWDRVVISNAPTQPIPNIHKHIFFNAATWTYGRPIFAQYDIFMVPNTWVNFILSECTSSWCIGIKFSSHCKFSYGGRQSLNVISYLRWWWNLFDVAYHIDCDCRTESRGWNTIYVLHVI